MQHSTPRAICHRPIDAVLPRLDRVRQTAAGRWSARCPAHDDSGPSLSIRETTDGTILLHDFAGCNLAAIVGALGISLRDLFPGATTSAARVHSPRRAEPAVKRPARWYDLENYSDDPMWKMFIGRAIQERAWKSGVEPYWLRDFAATHPETALQIVTDAAAMLRSAASA